MTSFTRTWDAAYETLPADSEDAKDGAGRIRNFKEDIQERVVVDHSFAGDADDGKHKKVTLIVQGADPTLEIGNTALYCKDVAGVNELFYKNENGQVCQMTSGGSLIVAAIPSGLMAPYGGAAAPTGWLLCDGAAVSRTTYAALFAAIGTAFGAGNGTTTFNVPDLRGRAPFGKDNMGGVAANRITNAVCGIVGTTLGASGGNQNVHQHSHTVNDPGHTHSLPNVYSTNSGATTITTTVAAVSVATLTGLNTTGITIANFGTGASQNIPPALITNYIIKT